MQLADLQSAVTQFRDERDWRQFHTPKDLAAAIAIEAGELSELFLWKSEAEIALLLDKPDFRMRLSDEMADVFSYLLSLSEVSGVDLGAALKDKLKKNAAKYPVEKAKGNAKKYNEK